MKPLFKTTIVIWSRYDPFGGDADILMSDDGLERLVRDSRDGDTYCSKANGERIEDPSKDPDWDGTEFFGVEEDNESELKEKGDDHPDADGDTVG